MSSNIIPVWLRDTYCRIDNNKISDVRGYSKENKKYKKKALESMENEFMLGQGDVFNANSKFYISGGDIFNYLNDNKKCDDIITIVIVGLKNLYWNHKDQLDETEISSLSFYLTKKLPSFEDIFDYKKVEKYNKSVTYPVYQLFNDITPYDVLYVSVSDFVDILNKGEKLHIPIEGTDIIIRLDYELYDFYSFKEGRLVTHLDIC